MHLVHYLFDSLRGPSQYARPVSRQSPAPVVGRKGSQSFSKTVFGEQRWLCRQSLTRGACPLLVRHRLLVFLWCDSVLRLFFASPSVLKRGRISEMQEVLPLRIDIWASVTPSLTSIKKRSVVSLCEGWSDCSSSLAHRVPELLAPGFAGLGFRPDILRWCAGCRVGVCQGQSINR